MLPRRYTISCDVGTLALSSIEPETDVQRSSHGKFGDPLHIILSWSYHRLQHYIRDRGGIPMSVNRESEEKERS